MKKYQTPLIITILVICIGFPLCAFAIGLRRDLRNGAKVVWLPPARWGFGSGIVNDPFPWMSLQSGVHYTPLYRYSKRGFFEVRYDP